MCRSKTGELPTGRLPNPMILPPLVVVVLNQASIVNVPGAATGVCVATSPLLPLNVDALSASPLIAPIAPRVTPVDTAPSSKPTESTAVAPADSPNRK